MNTDPGGYVMRTKMFLLLCATVAISSISRGAEGDAAILAAEKNWAKAVMALDFKALDEIYSDDLIYAHSTGIVETKKEYLDKLKQGTQKYSLIQHENITVRSLGNAAIAHANVRMKGTGAMGPFDSKLMMIHVWVQQDGKWRLAAHQTTKLGDY
jgi:ketosteroid isomerase-like protein